MRKIERQMLQAIVDDKDWSKDNTRVEYNKELKDGDQLIDPAFFNVYLHGHKIATYYPKDSSLYINNCGYETRTTKSRLNVLIDFVCGGVNNGIFQKGWNWYLVKDGKQSYFPSGEWVAV